MGCVRVEREGIYLRRHVGYMLCVIICRLVAFRCIRVSVNIPGRAPDEFTFRCHGRVLVAEPRWYECICVCCSLPFVVGVTPPVYGVLVFSISILLLADCMCMLLLSIALIAMCVMSMCVCCLYGGLPAPLSTRVLAVAGGCSFRCRL
jgi:hypothetical protein